MTTTTTTMNSKFIHNNQSTTNNNAANIKHNSTDNSNIVMDHDDNDNHNNGIVADSKNSDNNGDTGGLNANVTSLHKEVVELRACLQKAKERELQWQSDKQNMQAQIGFLKQKVHELQHGEKVPETVCVCLCMMHVCLHVEFYPLIYDLFRCLYVHCMLYAVCVCMCIYVYMCNRFNSGC